MLKDRFGRVHDYLRISLTDACNLRCSYCMPEHPVFTQQRHLMTAEEIIALSRIFVNHGVKKIRLTGGEPTLRSDFDNILSGLAGLRKDGLQELTLTTNGIRIHNHLASLNEAGVTAVNVSLDTMLPERFLSMAKLDHFHRVMSNIHLLLDHRFIVKVNVVVMKGINDDEVVDFIRWTRDYPVHIRFIEFMPFEGNRWNDKRLIRSAELLDRASSYFDFEPLPRNDHDTSKAFRVVGFSGTFAFISTMSEPFCGDCNRIRLTADGKLKNCLFSRSESDILGILRSHGDPAPAIVDAVFQKEARWGGQALFSETENRPMVAIGG